MERSEWLKEKRRTSEERMDTLWGPIYAENWGGTGKYWPLVLESGRRVVVGIDQSQGMLAQATAKFPQVPVQKLGLQEISDENTFEEDRCQKPT